jgi:hypothetical protein
MSMQTQSGATAFSHTGALAHSTQNDTRLSDFMKEVREAGRERAMGRDSLPNLAFKFIRAVADEVLDIAKDQNGDDAAARIFKTFADCDGNKAVHDRSADSVKAQISKMRALQKFASNPKWDAVQVGNDVFTAIADYRKDAIDTKSTYAALVDVAREQMKSDTQLTSSEIGVLVLPTTNAKEVTLESKLEKIAKQMEEIITGEGKDGIKDQSPELMQAAELVNTRRNELVKLATQAADDKMLAEIAARRGGVYVPTEG